MLKPNPLRMCVCALAYAGIAPICAASGLEDLLISSHCRENVAKAQEAFDGGDSHLALALVETQLYPTGVDVAIGPQAGALDRAVAQGALLASAQRWSYALGEKPIRVLPTTEGAEVVVNFVDALPEGAGDSIGMIDLTKRYRWGRSSHSLELTGTIYVLNGPPGGPLSSDELVNVFMHEIGHLLGLSDMDDERWLMGPMRRGKPKLSPTREEVEVVTGLRKRLFGLHAQYSGNNGEVSSMRTALLALLSR